MYSSTTRTRYASFFKTAEAALSVKFAGKLEKIVAKNPLILAALVGGAGAGGHVVGKAEQKKTDSARTDAWTQGVAYGHHLGKDKHHGK